MRLGKEYPKTPYAPYSLYYLGRIAQVEEKWTDAIRFYQKVLQKYPTFPLKADLLYYLSDCSNHAGQKTNARHYVALLEKGRVRHFVAPTVQYYNKTDRIEALRQSLEEK